MSSLNSSNSSLDQSILNKSSEQEQKPKSDKDKVLEEVYKTKNVGLFGFSLFSYISCKAKSLLGIQDENKIKLKPNDISNRLSIVQCTANNPLQDRFNGIQLKHLDGYYMSVLDGHGGHQVAEYANKRLHVSLDERLNKTKYTSGSTSERIMEGLNYAYKTVVRVLNLGV